MGIYLYTCFTRLWICDAMYVCLYVCMNMYGRMHACMQRLQRWIKHVNKSKLIEWDGTMPPFSFQITVLPSNLYTKKLAACIRLWDELHLSHPLVALSQEFPQLLIILGRVLLRRSGSMRFRGRLPCCLCSWCCRSGCRTGHWWCSGHRCGNRCWLAAAFGLRASRHRLVILTIWASRHRCFLTLVTQTDISINQIIQHLQQAPTLVGAEAVNVQLCHTLRPFCAQIEGLPNERRLKGKSPIRTSEIYSPEDFRKRACLSGGTNTVSFSWGGALFLQVKCMVRS